MIILTLLFKGLICHGNLLHYGGNLLPIKVKLPYITMEKPGRVKYSSLLRSFIPIAGIRTLNLSTCSLLLYHYAASAGQIGYELLNGRVP